MRPFRYVQASGLRLDAPLCGLADTASDAVNQSLADAAFDALTRLLALCGRERPDALVLVGDLFDQSERNLVAHLRLVQAFEFLRGIGVRVLVVPGVCDPLSAWQRFCGVPGVLPDNVVVCGDEPVQVDIFRDDRRVAVFYGAACAADGRLPVLCGLEEVNCPQIGAVCIPSVTMPESATMPNESLSALFQHSRLDVVALGSGATALESDATASGLSADEPPRSHAPGQIAGHPLLLWSGVVQGHGFHEPGGHGCLVVDVDRVPSGQWTATPRFEPLGPVVWRTVDIHLEPDTPSLSDQNASRNTSASESAHELAHDAPDVSGVSDVSLDALTVRLSRQLTAETADLGSGCGLIVLRLRLCGQTPLNTRLRDPRVRRTLCARLNEISALVWVAELDVRTTHPAHGAEDRQDLVGEIVRHNRRLQTPDAEQALQTMVREALAPLYDPPLSRCPLPELTPELMRELVRSAESFCLDQLQRERMGDGRSLREKR